MTCGISLSVFWFDHHHSGIITITIISAGLQLLGLGIIKQVTPSWHLGKDGVGFGKGPPYRSSPLKTKNEIKGGHGGI